MKRAVIIQCRLSSTRLPGKALLDLDGSPVLAWVLRSMKKVRADRYFVATDKDSYDSIFPICKENGFECFAGPLENVLERYCLLIKKIQADTVIRATADNPFLFYEAAQKSADEFDSWRGTSMECDYYTWTGLPHGSGVEVFNGQSLLEAAERTTDPYDMEHVGPALYDHKDYFRCVFEKAPAPFQAPELRTTIDTYQDYLRAQAICNAQREKRSATGGNYEAEAINGNETKTAIENKNKNEKSRKTKAKTKPISEEPFSAEEIIEVCRSKSVKSPIVLLPSVEAGHGTGHLSRMLKLARETFSFVYIPKDAMPLEKSPDLEDGESNPAKFLKQTADLVNGAIKSGLSPTRIISELPDDSFRPVFVSDMMVLPYDTAIDLSKRGTLVAIDDGSENETFFDYILDIIPSIQNRANPNLRNINFLDFPKTKRTLPKPNKKEDVKSILISFGGEDPAGLSSKTLEKCREIFPKAKRTVVSKQPIAMQKNEKLLETIPNLKEELHNFDIVFTHYGLTALEAAVAGCGVVLLPTTPLHGRLAEKYGFASTTLENCTMAHIDLFFTTGKIYPKTILEEIDRGNETPENSPTENPSTENSLSAHIKRISLGEKYPCPVCRTIKSDAVVSRNKFRTYRRCGDCGIVYISWSAENEQKYEKEYFFDAYKKQYGKTYKEDFNSIKQSCKKRISAMNMILKSNMNNSILFSENPAVLDIGCAYGPFLQAASESGWQPFGTDICEDAVKSVQTELRFPACVSAFPEINTESEFGIREFDAVTMWYVIEHFQDLDSVLKKANSLLKKGGVFAFSTPSGEGVSAKSNIYDFYQKSPIDHFSVWEPSRAKKALKKYGFRIVRKISTGHHPERFPSVKKHGSKPGSLRWNLVDKYSRLWKLGDTVEIYCVKC